MIFDIFTNVKRFKKENLMKLAIHGKLFAESYHSKVHDDTDVTKLLSFANKARNVNRTIIKKNFA